MGCASSKQEHNVLSSPSHSEKLADVTARSSVRAFANRYSLGDKLGEGTYSVVHIAQRKTDGSKVAVKIVSRDGMSPEDEAALLREVDIMKSFDHPNIVKVIEFFDEPDHYYLVLEYLAGGELFERLAQKTVYTENEARESALLLFQAIKYIHDKGIVHRDLKPENILLVSKASDIGIKITDFGFAARVGSGTIKQQAGTPGYVSPEVLERKPHGKPVDMWAMGVVLYMLLGGYPPFYSNEEDSRAMYRRILMGNYQFHPEYWSNISTEAKELITGLLTVDPEKRLTVDQVLVHPWIRKSKEELSLISLDRNLALLKDFRSARCHPAKMGALATDIAINVAKKVSGANLTSRNSGAVLNDVCVEVIRKLSNSSLNESARRRQSQTGTGGMTSNASFSGTAQSPNGRASQRQSASSKR